MSEERAEYNVGEQPINPIPKLETITRHLTFADGSELFVKVTAPSEGAAWGLAGAAYYRRILPAIEAI